MIRVLIADKLHPAGVELLRKTPGIEVIVGDKPDAATLCELAADVHAIVVRSRTTITEGVLEAAPELQVVGRAGIGVDNIDVTAASRRGVLVMNAPSGNNITTAEHALAMLMALARRIPQATASLRAGRWEKSRFVGRELYERTLGVVGLGNIGRLVATRARALGLMVIAADPFTTSEFADKLGVVLVEVDALLARADAITIHTPLTPKTRGLIGAEAFEKVRPGLLLVNCARGGIVDEAALLEALEKGKVAGAALDVFETEPPPADHPLLTRDGVICTPHLGASTGEAQEKVAVELAQQIADFLTGGTLRNAINLPAVRGELPARVRPYVDLAERLGRFQAQTFGGFHTVEVIFAGEAFAEMPALGLVTTAAVKGLLKAAMDVPVNLVNARILAEDHGVDVTESRTTAKGAFANLVTIRLTRDGESSQVSGALFNGDDPRLVKLDGFDLEAPLRGGLLVLRNEDRPGVIGNVGTVLGSNEINVSRLHVGLHEERAEAIALWNVAGAVPDGLVGVINGLPHIKTVRYVSL